MSPLKKHSLKLRVNGIVEGGEAPPASIDLLTAGTGSHRRTESHVAALELLGQPFDLLLVLPQLGRLIGKDGVT